MIHLLIYSSATAMCGCITASTRLRTERKHFIDTIKMIAYRAESSTASPLREHLARS